MSPAPQTLFDTRRHLTDFHGGRVGHVLTDVLIVGSGVAGCRAALAAAEHGRVILATKDEAHLGSTFYAQGGVAAVFDPEDRLQYHMDDTLGVGSGLCDPGVVRDVIHGGPAAIREIIDWGLKVDRNAEGGLDLSREGGHGHRRVVHAHGDQTGRELITVLLDRVRAHPDIRVFENCFLIDFLTVEGVCGGVTFHPRYGHQILWAKQTILAGGGCGRVYRETTNPAVSTGDGLAAAFRAGADVADAEFVQFHPTTLYVAGAARLLITEAMRGEGALLFDQQGRRFMPDYDERAELAPRDVVSRAITTHLKRHGGHCVYLDATRIPGVAARFPAITRICADFQIDIARDRIPVRPSAHYHVGGVRVDPCGRTTVPRLWCCGENSMSGLHGANRLASNSLLEGLVLGERTGREAGLAAAAAPPAAIVERIRSENPKSQRTELDLADILNSLKSMMWRNVGIVRHGDRLRETLDIIEFWGHYVLDKTFNDPQGWMTQNLLTVARLITRGALERDRSIGVHYREDDVNAASAGAPADLYHLCLRRSPQGLIVQRLPVTPA